ncbi:hypothetical protein BB560_002630 [Smittium megazygosporum]|uniref:Glycine cleavage system H protein n=1 Tax=Smittium megazygosporum TaxID=133381 RepID=A0A2T9ZEA3_9FUNG|nr:hypothetical protein BB560_002630 [Smittium megazygosporum]
MALNLLKRSFFTQRSLYSLSRFYSTKKYTESHEWISVEGEVGTVGITDYAQKLLGDVVYVELPEVDSEIAAQDNCGAVESVKAASDLYSPASGTIVDANQSLVDKPKLINKDPEGSAWLYKIKLSNASELDALMDKDQYTELVGKEDH